MAALVAVLALMSPAAGCSRPEKSAQAPLTERQRDSILATEPIPGAPAVGAALRASDKASERSAGMDSLPN
jgi:hypothetical protein